MRSCLKPVSIPATVPGVEINFVYELTAPTYGLNNSEAIQLESKKAMRARGVKSPNLADALACTFAFEIYIPMDSTQRQDFKQNHETPDYNPYEKVSMAS